MGLSSELISQFAKTMNSDTKSTKEEILYGTFVEQGDKKYVRLDGSELLTPAEQTAAAKNGERVSVVIKNHVAVITGNLSSPAARSEDVDDNTKRILEVGGLVADKVSTKELEAQIARIDTIEADNVMITQTLKAANASIESLEADNVSIKKTLNANKAKIDDLDANKLSATVADLKYATIESLDATDANIHNLSADYGKFKQATADDLSAKDATIQRLQTEKLSATDADMKYANIDFSNIGKTAIEQFYATSGIIKDLVIGDQTVTGELVGVTIKGDLIEGGTVVADKLVVKGQNGLYYKLNTDGVTIEAEQTDYNSLNGSVITAKSITASKVNVKDLVAFDATIGGFNITNSALYSGVKSSVNNTTRGIYQDKDGQLAVGDGSNYLKYFRDSDGKYKLDISAASLKFGASNKNLETVLDDAISDIGKRVEKAKIISEINQSPEQVSIKANKISLEGLVTANENFKILNDGSIEAKAAKITGGSVEIVDYNHEKAYISITSASYTDDKTNWVDNIKIFTSGFEIFKNLSETARYHTIINSYGIKTTNEYRMNIDDEWSVIEIEDGSIGTTTDTDYLLFGYDGLHIPYIINADKSGTKIFSEIEIRSTSDARKSSILDSECLGIYSSGEVVRIQNGYIHVEGVMNGISSSVINLYRPVYVNNSFRVFAVGFTSSNDKVSMWEDSEGGNIQIVSPNGVAYQMDAYNDNLRIYWFDSNDQMQVITIGRNGKVYIPNFSNDLGGYITRFIAAEKKQVSSVSDNNLYNVTSLCTFRDTNNALISGSKGNYIFGISAFSDKRLKENIKDSNVCALDQIDKIQYRSFDFLDKRYGDHENIGYVADELKDIFPECVVSVPQDRATCGYDELYQVEDKGLIKYLGKAIQELHSIVKEQSKEIQYLKKSLVI